MRLVFSWLDVIVCLCAPLLFSVWLLLLCGLPSLGIFSLLRIIGPLATVSSSCFPSLFLVAESSVSLFLLCSSLRCRVVLRSLCDLPCSLWTYSLMSSSPGGPFSIDSGFSSSCLGVPGGLPHVFFLSPVAFLSSSRGLLQCRGTLCALCFAPRLPLRLFLPLLCLGVGASWCVSSYGFVISCASCFLVLCFANVLRGCSPLGVVSLGSGSAGASHHLVLLPV